MATIKELCDPAGISVACYYRRMGGGMCQKEALAAPKAKSGRPKKSTFLRSQTKDSTPYALFAVFQGGDEFDVRYDERATEHLPELCKIFMREASRLFVFEEGRDG